MSTRRGRRQRRPDTVRLFIIKPCRGDCIDVDLVESVYGTEITVVFVRVEDSELEELERLATVREARGEPADIAQDLIDVVGSKPFDPDDLQLVGPVSKEEFLLSYYMSLAEEDHTNRKDSGVYEE